MDGGKKAWMGVDSCGKGAEIGVDSGFMDTGVCLTSGEDRLETCSEGCFWNQKITGYMHIYAR